MPEYKSETKDRRFHSEDICQFSEDMYHIFTKLR